jgi:FkbH-like protein
LTQKTNQFNLTTRRYSGQDIERLSATPGWAIYSVRARDRFGDSGIVGVAILHAASGEAEIDTLLLSCRVIGRGIETALLAFLVDECRAGAVRQLQGWFYPTAKNSPAAEFYMKHGFAKAAEKPLGTLWTLAVADARIECPAWIALNAGKEAPLANYAHS